MSYRTHLWTVSTNTDLTEGRGRQYVKHFCEAEATARRLAKSGYVQGTDCPVSQVEVLWLDGKPVLPTSIIRVEAPTAEDIAVQKRIDERQEVEARAKAAGLTDADIALLRGAP